MDSASNGYPSNISDAQQNGVPAAPAEDEITLQEIVGMLWGGKWVILGTFVAVLALGATYTFLQTPVYETSSLVLVESEEGGVSSFLGEEGGMSPFGAGQQNLANEILIAGQSEAITESVARRLDSMAVNPYTGDTLAVLTNAEGERRSVSEIAGDLAGNGGKMTMSAAAGGGNLGGQYESADAIRISVKGVSASEAALISNLYSEEYMNYKLRKSQESARSARQFLEQQVARFRNQVAQSEQRLEEYMEEEEAVALDQETERIVEQIASMEARRDELQIQLDMAESALQSKEEELNRIRPNLSERISSSLEAELAQVQREKAEASVEISNVKRQNPDLDLENPDTQRERDLARLQEKERALEAEADSLSNLYVEQSIAAGGIGSIPARTEGGGGGQRGRGLDYVVELQQELAEQRIEASGLRAQLNTAQDRLEEYEQQLDSLPEQSLQLARLERERRSREEIYQYVQQQLQETRMAEESEVGSTEMIHSAGVPENPVAPNTRLNLMLAAFLGLLAGAGGVFLREALDTKLRTPEDLETYGPKVLGTIPDMERQLEMDFEGEETVEIDGRSVPTEFVMLTSPLSAAAEGYRRLRANLQFARPDDPVQTLLVTSADKGAGKTTTAVNLAVSMASAGNDTLLIDADLRYASVHRYVDRQKSPGLTEALYDRSILEEGLETGIDRLSVLTGGGEVPNPSELLGARRMGQLIEWAEERFDTVIVDTSPLLLFSDPVSLVSHTDGALLVAEANETEGPAVEQAVSLLRDVGDPPLGGVLNRFDPEEAQSYGYGYEYGYGYGYYYDDVQEYYEEKDEESSGMLSFLRSR